MFVLLRRVRIIGLAPHGSFWVINDGLITHSIGRGSLVVAIAARHSLKIVAPMSAGDELKAIILILGFTLLTGCSSPSRRAAILAEDVSANTHTIAASISAAAPAPSRPSIDAPCMSELQWSSCDIALSALGTYSNPYIDVSISAKFTGPSGVTKNIQGYWDGGNVFKVRFTPTVVGTWSYSISSSPADPGLSQSGTISVGAPQTGDHGFLRRDPNNPYTFVFDDRTRFFVMGQTYYGIILNALDNGSWQTAVLNSKNYGFTKIRLLLFNWQPGAGAYYGHPYAQPFTTDHDHINLAYWQEMDQVISYMQSQGMIADLILFADDKTSWGTPAQNDRYLSYAIARYAAYPNLIWCVSNEWNYTDQPQKEIDHLGAMIASQDPYMYEGQAQRPLSVHQQTRIDFQFFGSSWPAHAIIQYGPRNGASSYGDKWGEAGIAYNWGHDMPVVNDEYGYIDPSNEYQLRNGTTFSESRTTIRNAIWGIAIAGGYGTLGGDNTKITSTNMPIFSGDWYDQPGPYGDIRVLSNVIQSVNYTGMVPQNFIVSGNRVYALGMNGDHFIYVATGQTFSVSLPGACSISRIDPRTGASTSLGFIGGGTNEISTPDGQDYLYHLTGSSCQ